MDMNIYEQYLLISPDPGRWCQLPYGQLDFSHQSTEYDSVIKNKQTTRTCDWKWIQCRCNFPTYRLKNSCGACWQETNNLFDVGHRMLVNLLYITMPVIWTLNLPTSVMLTQNISGINTALISSPWRQPLGSLLTILKVSSQCVLVRRSQVWG